MSVWAFVCTSVRMYIHLLGSVVGGIMGCPAGVWKFVFLLWIKLLHFLLFLSSRKSNKLSNICLPYFFINYRYNSISDNSFKKFSPFVISKTYYSVLSDILGDHLSDLLKDCILVTFWRRFQRLINRN